MFESISRGWEYAKISIGLILENKKLLVFPIMSSLGALAVLASFMLPLWMSGSLAELLAMAEEESLAEPDAWTYLTVFFFYLCDYFVIVFFNVGLVANVLRIMKGQTPSVSEGLSFAMRRLPQILGWSIISALIGVTLNAIEDRSETAGKIVASLFGAAWSALSFLVVPVIVVYGVGPVSAFKRSAHILRKNWGTALAGNASVGILSIILALPLAIVLIGMAEFGWFSGVPTLTLIVAVLVIIPLALMALAFNAAADMVFKTVLFAYATGRTLPDDIDTEVLSTAFASGGQNNW